MYQPGDRVISDLDLYVPLAARQAGIERLAHRGYTALADAEQAGPPGLRSSLALARGSAGDLERITVDLHWAIDPVRRLLPRADRPVPAPFWHGVTSRNGIRVPAPEHHAALLAHHLVHTDLAHVRSLLDLALLFAELDGGAGADYVAAARELGVGEFAMDVARLVARDLGVARPAAIGSTTRRGAAGRLTLDDVLSRAMGAPSPGDAITTRRIRTRITLLGWGAAPSLLTDILVPPAAFLAWRWPGASPAGALLRHYRQVARKMFDSP